MRQKQLNKKHKKYEGGPIPFDDALRRILSAPPNPRIAKKKPTKKRAKKD